MHRPWQYPCTAAAAVNQLRMIIVLRGCVTAMEDCITFETRHYFITKQLCINVSRLALLKSTHAFA